VHIQSPFSSPSQSLGHPHFTIGSPLPLRLALKLILAVFPQTLPGERALGVLPLIDLALPAFVGPNRDAKVY